MTLIKSISGIRGIIDKSINPNIVQKYVQAFCEISPDGIILLGRDTRAQGIEYVSAAIDILNQIEREFANCGIIPTPTAQLLVEKKKYSGAIIFTASHNPSNWNGMKFIDSTGTFIGHEKFNELENKASKIIINQDFTNYMLHNNVEEFSDKAIEFHINNIIELSIINKNTIKKSSFRVAIDCTNGATCKALPGLLNTLNCKIKTIHSDFNEKFNRSPEPIPENLTDLSKLVIDSEADVGFATDPDGDRLSIVDNLGKPLGEELTLSLAIYYFLKYFPKLRKNPVVTNLSTSKLSEIISKRFNTSFIRTAVGEINVVEGMIKSGAAIGGEGNGGVILKESHLGRDSLVATSIILNLLANEKKSLNEICESLPQLYIYKTSLNIESINTNIFDIIEENFKNETIIKIDGLKIEFNNDDWVHIRKSNTEPILRIISESRSDLRSIKLAEQIIDILN